MTKAPGTVARGFLLRMILETFLKKRKKDTIILQTQKNVVILY